MSMSDDPRGFRRPPPVSQRYSASQGREDDPRSAQRGDGRGGDDNFGAYRQPPAAPERQQERARERQPTFSAYRPEAYAASSRGQNRPEPHWEEQGRSAPMPPRPDPRDPYHGSGVADPYAPPQSQPQRHYEQPLAPPRSYEQAPPPPAASRDFEADWRQESYSDRQQPDQFANYYQQRDDGIPDVDAQSVHNSFFAAAEPEPAPPPRQNRSRMPELNDFSNTQNDFGNAQNDRDQAFGPSENDQDYGWDNFEQTPQKAAPRTFHPPVPIPDDDLDADFFADEDDFDGEDYASEKGSGRKKLMAAVLIGAVVTGGGLAYVYKNNTIGVGGEPPFVTADAGPVKETPADPGGRAFPNGNKLIYDRLIDGEGAEPTRTDEGSAEADGEILQGAVSSPGTLEERINQALKAQQAANSNAPQSGDLDSPRRVQTLTIRPDGSVDQPAQPVVSTQDIQTADISNEVIISQQPDERLETSSSDNTGSATLSGSDTQESQGSDLLSNNGNSDSGSSDVANSQPVQQIAAAAPQPDNSEVRELTGGSGEYFVQVGARNDQEAAETAFKTLQKKYASILGNHQNFVRKADLGEKGVWYRLWVGPVNTEADAQQLCTELKTAGMPACLTRKDGPQ